MHQQQEVNLLKNKVDVLTTTFGNLFTDLSLKKAESSKPEPQLMSPTKIQSLVAEEILYKQRVEEDLRFIPKILLINKKEREVNEEEEEKPLLSIEVKSYISKLSTQVLSEGFAMLKKDMLNSKQMRSYCSERIIFNLIKLIQDHQMNADEVKAVNSFFEGEALNYIILKYPKSEDKEVNQTFKNIVSEVINLDDNDNDLVFRSGVKFHFREDGNYNSQIMQFLNYMMQLPDEKIRFKTEEKEEEWTLNDLFQKEVGNFFRRIEDKEKMEKMKFTDEDKKNPRDPSLFNLLKDGKEMEKQNEKDKKYAEEVKAYSKHESNRKLSKNTEIFSSEEIKEGKLDFKSSAMMRIGVKWCQHLKEIYEKTKYRKEPFRMQNGKQLFLRSDKHQSLCSSLHKQKAEVDKKLKEIMANNYEQQSFLSGEKHLKDLDYLPEFEAKTGLFNAHLEKNSKVYLIAYLNTLIHGLLKVVKEEDLEVQLISFNIGDLLRSRCYSKEKEIIGLYHELLRINYHRPDLFKIVTVRNRLSGVTKDILVNILYRNKIVIEMQLGIKTDKSRFIECSDKMNHFIYELQRGIFGPLVELSSVWMAEDQRADFYQKKADERKNSKKKHQCQGKKQKLTLPFKCDICQNFLSNLNEHRHKKCLECQKNICFDCTLRNIKNLNQLKKEFPELEEIEDYSLCKGDTQLPEVGLIVDVNSKAIVTEDYQVWEKDGKKQLLIKTSEEEIKCVGEVKQRNGKEVLPHNFIVLHKSQMKKFLSEEEIRRDYEAVKVLDEADSKGYASISMMELNVDDERLGKREIKSVKKINLNQNKISSLGIVGKVFHELEFLAINWNRKLKKIERGDFERLKNLTELYLEGDEWSSSVQSIDQGIKELKHLKVLSLSHNEGLKSLPDGLCECKELVTLNLRQCFKLKTLPENIGNLKELMHLDLKSCQCLIELPESIGRLKKLTILNLFCCFALNELPESIAQLQALERLNIINCQKLKALPPGMGKLTNLQSLQLPDHEQLEVPFDFSNCQELTALINVKGSNFKGINAGITELQITFSVPETLWECTSIEKLSIQKCHQIPSISKEIHQLSNLSYLSLNLCHQLVELPSTLSSCEALTFIQISYCPSLRSIPDPIGNCKKLQFVKINHSPLPKMPKVMHALKKLQLIKVEYLENLPQCPQLNILQLRGTTVESLETLTSCPQLKQIKLKNISELSKVPDEIAMCKKIQTIYLEDCEDLAELSQEIGQCSELKSLKIKNCSELQLLPETIIDCPSLVELEIDSLIRLPFRTFTKEVFQKLFSSNKRTLEEIPSSIESLKEGFTELNLSGYKSLKQLPPNIDSLYRLQAINLEKCLNIERLPPSVEKLSRLRRFSISQCEGFESLPEALKSMKGLKELKVEECPLEYLPESQERQSEIYESVGGCQQLEILTVRYCPFTRMPQTMPQLKQLSLEEVGFLELFPSCPQLNKLSIGRMQISWEKIVSSCLLLKEIRLEEIVDFQQVPDEVRNLEGLQKLQIKNCSEFEKISENIGQCSQLKCLIIQDCPQLHSLPQSITNCPQLTDLSVSGLIKLPASIFSRGKFIELLEMNKSTLQEMPSSIDQLKEKLTELNLSGYRNIKHLPSNIGNLHKLQNISLEGWASLQALPPQRQRLSRLKKFSICGSEEFESLSESLQLMKRLKELKVEECPLQQLPETEEKQQSETEDQVKSWQKLEIVNIKSCPLGKMPKTMPQLKQLYLENVEPLQDLPACPQLNMLSLINVSISCLEMLASYPYLKQILLIGLQITMIPGEIRVCQELEKIRIKNCQDLEQLSEEIGLCSQLKSLKIQDCPNLRSLPESITDCPQLTELMMKGLTKLPANIFASGKFKELLMLNRQTLQEIPPSIDQLKEELVKLNLSNNKRVKKLPASVGDLHKLQNMILTDCKILESLPSTLNRLHKLSSIDLRGCTNLQKLPPEIAGLAELKELNLMDCPRLKRIPIQFRKFKQLNCLWLGECQMVENRPEDVEHFQSVGELNLMRMQSSPELILSIAQLKNLTILHLEQFTNFRWFSSSFRQLAQLKTIRFIRCNDMQKLTPTVCECVALEKLIFQECEMLESLPQALEMAKHLEDLRILECPQFKNLPDSIGGCSQLKVLRIKVNESLRELPIYLGDCLNLRQLDLYRCQQLDQLPESLGNCRLLKRVCINEMVKVPEEVRMVKGMNIVFDHECDDSD